jgi:hypothetical protein
MIGTSSSSSSYWHVQAFSILFIVSLLVFLSSFVSLNHIITFHEAPHVKEAGKVHFLSRSRGHSRDISTNGTSSLTSIVNEKAKSIVKTACKVTFRPKCSIHPSIHYWNEETDCYVSPLQSFHGLNATLENKKFVVFQPDLGGWNNIRMALEVVILFAKVTGRILVFPPQAVLYLLIKNKKWGDNKSTMEDYFDFDRLREGNSLDTMEMKDFLTMVAKPGLLSAPLPDNNIDLIKKPLWDYLEKASYSRLWAPGKSFIGFNISRDEYDPKKSPESYIGDFSSTSKDRIIEFSLGGKRDLQAYNTSFHSHRSIFFAGYEENRLLTHFYSYLFFASASEDRLAKRFMRDRLRYHDEIFCVGSRIIERLLELEGSPIELSEPMFIAFHIRRGDFQQKHTRLPAERIVELTNHLVPDRKDRIAYIATDEGNRSFFEPFAREYKKIYFLNDISANSGIEEVNANYIGMIEQVVCAAAHTFIGTPLSTFTAYITRMRGYMNRTVPLIDRDSSGRVIKRHQVDRRGIYNRTYYFMNHHMHQLHTKPKVHFPLWIRDFVDVFKDIDETEENL